MIRLEIVGVPAPQGSKTRTRYGMIEGSSDSGRASLTAWRKAVADAARRWLADNPQPPLDEPLKIMIAFRFAPVKSDPYRTLHTTAPDVDKLTRAVFDSLKHGGLVADDARFCKLDVDKRYAVEGEAVGATVEIVPLGAVESAKRDLLKKVAAIRRKGGMA